MNFVNKLYKLLSCCWILLCFTIGDLFSQDPAPAIRYNSYNPVTEEYEIRWDPFLGAPRPVSYYQVWYYYPKRGDISPGWLQIKGDIPASSDLVMSFSPNLLLKANPLKEPVIVGIQAYDAADQSLNLLIENTFDSTIFFEASFDTCLSNLNLKWTPYRYKQWPQPGLTRYDIYISEDNGTTYNVLTSLPASQTEIDIQDLEANKDYKIYVSSVSENTPGDQTNSFPLEVNTNMTVIPEYLYADYASYSNNNVELSFTIDPGSETTIYNLLRSNLPNGAFEKVTEFNTEEKEIKYTDVVDYNSGPFYYKLEVINNCEISIRESENLASSINLLHDGIQLMPGLTWNSYQNWLSGGSTYSIYRKFDNTDFVEIASIPDTLYTDSELESLVENNFSSEVCYQIVVSENNGTAKSVSNPLCYQLPPNIRFEFDAFMPGSGTDNNTFGPTIDFLPDEYQFEILDRSGRKVYESKDPENTRWDGYIDGSLAPEGAYMCVIQYKIGNSKKRTITGAVMVVY